MGNDSILTSTKKILGIEEEYDIFDMDIIAHINSVFLILTQIGVGPEEGFSIEDSTETWEDFVGSDPRLKAIQSFVYLRVRLLFDPPQTSFVIDALNNQAKEFEWRLNIQADKGIVTP